MGYWEIVLLLAINCWHECPNEPVQGQIAVAQVLQNRAIQRRTSIEHELFRPHQFSWTDDKRSHLILRQRNSGDYSKFAQCLAVSALAYSIPDLTSGANHYHADYIKKPKWANGMTEVAHIGRHIFYFSEYKGGSKQDDSGSGKSASESVSPEKDGANVKQAAPLNVDYAAASVWGNDGKTSAVMEASKLTERTMCLMPYVVSSEGNSTESVPSCQPAVKQAGRARGPP